MTRVSDNNSTAAMKMAINRAKTDLERLQMQGATLKRIARPSDDPVSNVQAMSISSANSDNTQYQRNIVHAVNMLNTTDQSVEQLVEILNKAKEIAISLTFKPAPDPLTVNADKKLLSRVIQNLIDNAFNPSINAKNIEVSINKQESEVVFCVSNDGLHIPEKYIKKIFEKFFQIEVGHERKKYGIGIGLTFCKMAVDAMGGDILVETDKKGTTCFKVKFKSLN